MNDALVSVVTPFHNTALYLSQCIESVLGQSYTNFEYILSDNCSTDGSTEIAEEYARRDPRIRLIRQPTLLPQVQHYNAALAEISDSSRFCKVVQADDAIFPDCLKLMVRAFEQSDSIGLVSAYDIKRNTVRGSGFPYPTAFLPGRELARLYLRNGLFVFGSPTTVMYRSDLVRNCKPFYDESLLHEDTEKCMRILADWDFGFVHQVLSFLRADNDSISRRYQSFRPDDLDRYILVRRYAPIFLDSDESMRLVRQARRSYYRRIARSIVQLGDPEFRAYHRQGLKTIGETMERPYLFLQFLGAMLSAIANPGASFMRIVRWTQRKREGRTEVPSVGSPPPQTTSSIHDGERHASMRL